jgi:PAS domain S-box-containing protein
MSKAEMAALSTADLQTRLNELEAVIDALRDHQVDAIVGDTDVALVHLRQVEEALRESGERYRAFVSNSSEGIWRYEIDPPMPVSLSEEAQVEYIFAHGYLAECNDAMARMAGYERASELIGARGSFVTAFPGPREALRQFVASKYRIEQIEALRTDRHGNERWLAMSFLGLPYHNTLSRIWGVQRDITERRWAEEGLRQRTKELTALLAVTRELATTLDLEPLLDNVLSQLRTVIDFTGASIATAQGEQVVVAAYDGPLPHSEVIGQNVPLSTLANCASLITTPSPVIFSDQGIQDVCPPELWEHVSPLLAAQDRVSRGWLIAPLRAKSQLVGLLALEHKDPHHFTEWHAQLAQAFADHAAVAIENARLYKEARFVAAITERQRLAAELHDSVTQSIYGISLAAHTAIPLVESRPDRVRSVLTHILGLADAAFADVRSLIFELRPETLERHGLVVAIERQAQPLRVREQIALHFELGKEPNCALTIKEAVYRIAQESLNNIGKHAHAKEVWVKLEMLDSTLCLEVRDDGGGFDPMLDYGGHLGLQVMKERAERLGGVVAIESRPGAGATVRAKIPIPQPAL